MRSQNRSYVPLLSLQLPIEILHNSSYCETRSIKILKNPVHLFFQTAHVSSQLGIDHKNVLNSSKSKMPFFLPAHQCGARRILASRVARMGVNRTETPKALLPQ
jgi:hypothetical protein